MMKSRIPGFQGTLRLRLRWFWVPAAGGPVDVLAVGVVGPANPGQAAETRTVTGAGIRVCCCGVAPGDTVRLSDRLKPLTVRPSRAPWPLSSRLIRHGPMQYHRALLKADEMNTPNYTFCSRLVVCLFEISAGPSPAEEGRVGGIGLDLGYSHGWFESSCEKEMRRMNVRRTHDTNHPCFLL